GGVRGVDKPPLLDYMEGSFTVYFCTIPYDSAVSINAQHALTDIDHKRNTYRAAFSVFRI
nr:hypothetical protein [Lachnospiraceae bacterium]